MSEIHDDGRPFDWREMQASVVLHEQPTTAVYSNVNGHIVIRQEGPDFEDDAIVTIAPENLEAVIHAMREQAEMLAHERECMAGRRSRGEPNPDTDAPLNPDTSVPLRGVTGVTLLQNRPTGETVNSPPSETVASATGLFDV